MKRGKPLKRENSPQTKIPRMIEISPSQREKNGFMIFVLKDSKMANYPTLNKKNASLDKTAGRGKRQAESVADQLSIKNPENNNCFRDMNPFQNHAGPVVITFYYPDYTVGLGISTSHARFCGARFPKKKLSLPKEARGLYHRSGIHLKFYIVKHRCHPAPKVKYLIVCIIT
jgi:hypothetical protein